MSQITRISGLIKSTALNLTKFTSFNFRGLLSEPRNLMFCHNPIITKNGKLYGFHPTKCDDFPTPYLPRTTGNRPMSISMVKWDRKKNSKGCICAYWPRITSDPLILSRAEHCSRICRAQLEENYCRGMCVMFNRLFMDAIKIFYLSQHDYVVSQSKLDIKSCVYSSIACESRTVKLPLQSLHKEDTKEGPPSNCSHRDSRLNPASRIVRNLPLLRKV